MKSFDYKKAYIFDEYFIIDAEAYHEKIRYFDEHLEDILELPFDQSCKIRLDHAIALSKVGAHRAYLRKAEDLIRIVITENIFQYNGKDVFQELLFNKAKSLNATIQYDRAEEVLTQLIRMNPRDDRYKKLFIKTMVTNSRQKAQTVRGISIFAFLMVAVVTAIELLLVKSFFPPYLEAFEIGRIGLFVFANLLLLSHELYIRVRARNKYKTIS